MYLCTRQSGNACERTSHAAHSGWCPEQTSRGIAYWTPVPGSTIWCHMTNGSHCQKQLGKVHYGQVSQIARSLPIVIVNRCPGLYV